MTAPSFMYVFEDFNCLHACKKTVFGLSVAKTKILFLKNRGEKAKTNKTKVCMVARQLGIDTM